MSVANPLRNDVRGTRSQDSLVLCKVECHVTAANVATFKFVLAAGYFSLQIPVIDYRLGIISTSCILTKVQKLQYY